MCMRERLEACAQRTGKTPAAIVTEAIRRSDPGNPEKAIRLFADGALRNIFCGSEVRVVGDYLSLQEQEQTQPSG